MRLQLVPILNISLKSLLQAFFLPSLNFLLVDIKDFVFSTYDTYTVKPEDTLWSTAKEFNLTVLKLMELNGLKGSLIYPRQILKIM